MAEPHFADAGEDDNEEVKFDQFNFQMDDHASMAASSTDMAPGPSTATDKKFNMGKAPKRRNIRNVLSPEQFQFGDDTIEERRREQERQQRVNHMMMGFYNQQQMRFPYYQQPPQFSGYLSEQEQAEIAARQAIWRSFKNGAKLETGGDDVVVLSSDEEEHDQKPNDAKRLKRSGSTASKDSDCVCLGSDVEEDAADGGASCSTDGAAASMHVNDTLNVADDQGRVLINVGHADSESDVFLTQHLVDVIKPHQIGGLRFMYDNVVESLNKFNPNGGFGCILAHSMGLGKTFQVVTFSDVVYRHTPLKRILLIVPVNTLQNWLHEFEMWCPKSSFQRDVPPRQFDVSIIADGCKTWASRAAVINDWYKRKGVLILGYEMFRMLTNKISGVSSKKGKPPNFKNGTAGSQGSHGSQIDEGDADLKEVARALIDPGPDLVVCDEGHRIKNFQSHTSKALTSIKTKRRIVLTGYPLQNNLMEYWCMVNFVRPNYLGTRQEFANVFERPIKNGQCVDSTEKDIKVMRYRVHVLTNLLRGFVQRRSHTLLSTTLPDKSEFVLFLRKSPIQHRLYRRFIVECTADMRDDVGSWNPLKAFAVCCKIWNHPDVLYKAVKNRVDAVDGDLELDAQERGSSPTPNGKQKSHPGYSSMSPYTNGLFQIRTKKDYRHIDYRWAEDLFKDYTPGIVENGMKMLLALKIIERSVKRGDKILLFSQSLLTLDALESFLSAIVVPGSDERWKKNRNYFRLDGSTNSVERQRLIARFNNERGVYLFLISTRAGSLGINLVGANRVIVFDASFNPCHDAQAVCRVYRYGQKKRTYIYRLVADNSMEKTIFNRQLGKQGIADRVIDERAMDAALCRQDLYDLLQYNEEQDMITEDCGIDPESVPDELLVDVCNECVGCLAKAPVAHESLMLDRGDQKLSEEEKREAKRGYEREKKLMKQNGGIDWKRWQTDSSATRPSNNNNFHDFSVRPQRNWVDNGPPAFRFAPTPMMLQSAPSPYHQQQMVNGSAPASSTWSPQMQYQQLPPASSFVQPIAPMGNQYQYPMANPVRSVSRPKILDPPQEIIVLDSDED